MSFRVLPFFLPSPAKRGVRKQKMSPVNCSALLYTEVSVILLHTPQNLVFVILLFCRSFMASLFSSKLSKQQRMHCNLRPPIAPNPQCVPLLVCECTVCCKAGMWCDWGPYAVYFIVFSLAASFSSHQAYTPYIWQITVRLQSAHHTSLLIM